MLTWSLFYDANVVGTLGMLLEPCPSRFGTAIPIPVSSSPKTQLLCVHSVSSFLTVSNKSFSQSVFMSISSSFRLLSPKFSQSLHPKYPIPKTLIPSSISSSPNLSKFPLFSSISIERLPTKTSTSSSPPSFTSVSQQPIEDLPPQLQEIIKLFQSVQESKAKYEQLLFYGKKLKPLEPRFKTSENKVQGCVSQVWVRAYFDSEKNVRFEADSDSVLTKGLAALLVQGLSGQPVSKILTVSPGFVTLLGLQQSLSPSRNNGFLNMLRLMQNKALQLYKEAEEGGNVVSEVENGVQSSNSESRNEVANEDLNTVVNSDMGDENSSSGTAGNNVEIKLNSVQQLGSRGERIKSLIEKELNPIEMEVEDISYQHAGHAGVRGSAGETHFNLRIVSKEFEGKSQVKRHRLIYNLLKEELENGLHALSIVAKTPSEAER